MRVRSIYLHALLIGISGSCAAAENNPVDVFWGCHSSYFFTPLPFFQPAVDMLFASLEANPDFKVVMELDPYTLKRMKEGEKFAFERYKNEGKTLRDDARLGKLHHYAKRGQIEIIGGAYTQPIMHTLGDEAVIRQFTHGIRAVEEALEVPVRIYGYQEDGACSQIPQILNAAGFEAVVADTFFGTGYYPPARKALENFWWIGPDGSKIHSTVSITASMPGNHTIVQALPSKPEELEKMFKAGARQPLFGTFRDFFAPYAPQPDLAILKERTFPFGGGGEHRAQIVTLGEYFKAIGKPQGTEIDLFKGRGLEYGYGILAGAAERADRESENLLVQAERLLAIRGIDAKGRLDDAWDAHLSAQHHDARLFEAAIHAFGIFKQRTYTQMVKEAFAEAGAICKGLMREAGCLMPDGPGDVLVRSTGFAVVNTAGSARKQTLAIHAALPQGAVKEPAVFRISQSRRSAVPAEVAVRSRHADGSAHEVDALLLAQVPGMGSERYEMADGPKIALSPVQMVTQAGSPGMDNGLVRVIAAGTGVRIIGQGRSFPVLLAGNFIGKGQIEQAIGATKVGNDGASGTMHGEGEIGGVRYKAVFRLEPDSPTVRLRLDLDCGEKTDVGTKAGLKASDQKLRVVIPLPFDKPRFFSHAAFDVRPVESDTYPILRYAMAEGAGGGIAVLTDRTAAGIFRKEPSALEIALAYSGNHGRNAGNNVSKPPYYPLTGQHAFEFCFIPYDGDWQQAGIPRWSDLHAQPLLVAEGRSTHEEELPLVTMEPADAAVLTAVTRNGKDVSIRLWRPYDGESSLRVRVRGASALSYADLLGRRTGKAEDAIRMRHDQFITLHASMAD